MAAIDFLFDDMERLLRGKVKYRDEVRHLTRRYMHEQDIHDEKLIQSVLEKISELPWKKNKKTFRQEKKYIYCPLHRPFNNDLVLQVVRKTKRISDRLTEIEFDGIIYMVPTEFLVPFTSKKEQDESFGRVELFLGIDRRESPFPDYVDPVNKAYDAAVERVLERHRRRCNGLH